MTTDNKTMAVDVLAVMDGACEVLRRKGSRSPELENARAAVAELIEASSQVHHAIAGNEDWGRLWSAIARAQGEAA